MDGLAVRLTRKQAVAFRLARHHLAVRLGPDGTQSAAVVGLQDTPPGTAALALAARADVAPDALDELVLVPSIRGAPLAVAQQDLSVFTAGLEPPDEEAAKALVGSAWKSLDGITALEALDRVSDAVHDSLRDGPLARDDFHQALRERLPRGCCGGARAATATTCTPPCGGRPPSAACWRSSAARAAARYSACRPRRR